MEANSILSQAVTSLLASALLLSAPSYGEVPPGVEVFRRAGLDAPMKIETSNHSFSVWSSDDGYHIRGRHSNGNRIAHTTMHGGINNVDRVFMVESYFCGEKFVDLVLQMNPLRHAETQRRRYYRIVFSSDLTEVVSEFYDPSVAAVNAVAPMQAVEGIPEPELGGQIVCDGSTPKVVYP